VSTATLLLPDFLLILLGVLLKKHSAFTEDFWSGLERLVYFVLFPSLLFASTASTRFDAEGTGKLLVMGLAVTAAGVLLGSAIKPWFRADPLDFASGVQTAFRFNSYIALAIAGRLGGTPGIAIMALLIGTSVPLANTAAVYGLARHGGATLWVELARNPLIIGTLAGLIVNACGLALPETLSLTLGRLGSASVALGLITVGAGLRMTGARTQRFVLGWWLAVKLLALPAIALALAEYGQLAPLPRQILVMFGALPAASSAYILAVRMGGNGPLVAFLISTSTLISALTLPLWLALVR
jgi:predicted permease